MIVSISKLVVLFFILANYESLYDIGDELLTDLRPYPKLTLIMVMIIVPLCVNTIQFWVQDAFLKGDKHI